MWDLGILKVVHERARKQHVEAEADAMQRAGEAAAANVRTMSRFKRRSAQSLKDATKHRVIRSAGGRILRLTWPKQYASYLEHGTRPHPIDPVRAPRLVFFWERFGCWVSLKHVDHPGTRATHFGTHARKAAYYEMGQRLRFGMRRVSSRFRF